MPIHARCDCGKQFQVEQRHAGKRLRCPDCQAIVPIPGPQDPAGAAPAVAPGLVSTACDRHPGQAAAATCQICQTVICRECISEHGYFCSAACKTQAKEQWAPAVEDQAAAERVALIGGLASRAVRWLGIGLVAACAIALLLYLIRPQGELLWNTRTENLTYMQPLLRGEQLLVATNRKKLLTVDVDTGKTAAELALPEIPSPVPPLLAGEVVLVACGRSVVGCDPAAGKVLWRFTPPKGQVCQPLALGSAGVVVVFRAVRGVDVDRQAFLRFHGPPRVYCLDPASGKQVWVAGDELGATLPVCVGQGLVRFLGRASGFGSSRELVWLDDKTGKPIRRTKTGGDAQLALAGEDGLVLQTESKLSLLDAKGERWSRQGVAFAGAGAGLIFAYDGTFDLLALEAGTGKTRWKKAVSDEEPPMAISDRYVVLRAQGKGAPAGPAGSNPKAILRRMQRAMAAGGRSAPALQILRTADGSDVVTLEPGAYEARLADDRLILIRGRVFFTMAAGPMAFKEDTTVLEYRLPSGKEVWKTRGAGFFHAPIWHTESNRLYLLAEFHPPGPNMELIPKGGSYWENQLYGFSLR